MKEQADAERTKTEWTDQEREHTSHTQHPMSAQSEASTNATFDDVLLLDRSLYYWAPAIQTHVE